MKKLVLIVLSLAMLLTLAACGKSAGAVITAAKDRDGLDGGAMLSAADASALTAEITAAEKDKDWINAVSDCIASCYLSIEDAGKETVYKYCEEGVLDDLTNFRSLTLGDAAREKVNAILSGYVELGGIPLAALPELGEIEIIPRG